MKKYNLNQIIVEEYRKIVSEAYDPCAQVKPLETKISKLKQEVTTASFKTIPALNKKIKESEIELAQAKDDCNNKEETPTKTNNDSDRSATTSKSKVGPVQDGFTHPDVYEKGSTSNNGNLNVANLKNEPWLGDEYLSPKAYHSLLCIYNTWFQIDPGVDKDLPKFVSGYRS